MLRRLSTLSVIMAIVLLSVTATSISDRKVAVAAYETNAYDLRAAFHDGWEPHYGAFFSPIGPGWNARFVGACNACQSSGGCPNTWGWWGTNRNVLLVPKGNWLWGPPAWCGQWNWANYRATFN